MHKIGNAFRRGSGAHTCILAIEKQRGKDGTVYVSTVLFDNESEVIHDRVRLEDIKPMTLEDYCLGGATALLDAIGGAIHHIGNVHNIDRENQTGKKAKTQYK